MEIVSNVQLPTAKLVVLQTFARFAHKIILLLEETVFHAQLQIVNYVMLPMFAKLVLQDIPC